MLLYLLLLYFFRSLRVQWSNNNLIKKKVKEEKSYVSQPIQLFLQCQFLDRLNDLVGFLFMGPMGLPLLCVPMKRSHIHNVKILFQMTLLNFVDKGVTTPSKSYLPAAKVNKPWLSSSFIKFCRQGSNTPSKSYLPAAKVNKPLMELRLTQSF